MYLADVMNVESIDKIKGKHAKYPRESSIKVQGLEAKREFFLNEGDGWWFYKKERICLV